MQTLGQFRENLGLYNKTINNYMKVFECNWNNKAYVTSFVRTGLRDYSEITRAFESMLLTHKPKMQEFQRDFYSTRTIGDIANFINLNPDELADFISEIQFGLPLDIIVFDSDYKLQENGVRVKHRFKPSTKLQRISSYGIRKRYALEQTRKLLDKKMQEIT